MSISDNYVPVKTLGNGSTDEFTGNWKMIAAGFERVYLEDVTTGVQALQTVTTHYTMTFDDDGFVVTFVTPPTSDDYVVISRVVSQDQIVPYRTSKGFQGSVHENSYDKLTAINQDQQDYLDRTPAFPLGATITNPILPIPVDGFGLVWDGTTGKVRNTTASLANLEGDAETVADNIASIVSVAADLDGADNIGTVAAELNGDNDIETVADAIVNVNAVGDAIADVTTVAGDLSGSDTIGTVAGSITNVNLVGADIANVNAVGSNIADVAAVASDIGGADTIGVIAANLVGTNTIGTVAGDIANVNTVAGDIANVNTVATNISDVNDVADDISSVVTAAGDIASIVTVATNLNGTDTIGAVAAIDTEVTAVAGSLTELVAIYNNLDEILAAGAGSVPFSTEAAAGSSFTKGDIGKLTSAGVVDASAATESQGNGILLIANENIADGALGDWYLIGKVDGFTGLTPDVTQYLGVAAGAFSTTQPNADGNIVRGLGSATSATEFFFNPDATYTVISINDAPDAINDLAAVAGANSVALSWTEPNTNGSPITGYKVDYKLATEPTTWTEFSNGSLPEEAQTVTGLTNALEYDFRVFAINAIGTSLTSNEVSATPEASQDVEDIITTGMELFLDGKSYAGSGDWLNQIASPDSGASQSNYDVTPTDASLWDDNKWVMDNTGFFNGGANTTFLNNLHKTTGSLTWTLLSKFRTPSGSPQMDMLFSTAATAGDYGLAVRVDSGGNLKLDHFDGTTKNTDTIANGIVADTDYTIAIAYDYATDTHYVAVNADTFTTNSGLGWTDATTTNATDNFNICADGDGNGVMNSGTYVYGLWGVNKVISNTELAAFNDYTDTYYTGGAATAPDQVGTVIAVPDDTAMNLSWPVPSNGGSAITDYVIEYKLTSEPTTWTTFSDGASTTPSTQVTGLTNDLSYDFRVSAVNSVGTGTASATTTATPAAGSGGGSGDPYDESPYKVTLPENSSGQLSGNAHEISQPAFLTYAGTWFLRPDDGTFTFICPDGGATTSTATYARCELRHLTDISGTTPTTDELDVSVDELAVGHKTIIHQIHGLSEPPWFKTTVHSRGAGQSYIYALVKQTNGASDTRIDLKLDYTLGERVILKVEYTGTALKFYVDGSLVDTITISRSDEGYYWKRGNYYQNNAQVGNTCKVTHYTNANNYI